MSQHPDQRKPITILLNRPDGVFSSTLEAGEPMPDHACLWIQDGMISWSPGPAHVFNQPNIPVTDNLMEVIEKLKNHKRSTPRKGRR